MEWAAINSASHATGWGLATTLTGAGSAHRVLKLGYTSLR